MAPLIPNRWTTDPEYIELLNYLVERTKDAKSPMNMMQLAKEFKEKNGDARTVSSLRHRIERMRTRIHSFKHIDKKTKAKLMFALSAPVDADFLKQLKKDAVVEIDKKKRITHYKTKDGRLELRGDHSQSAKNRTAQLESKRGHRKLVRNYFENKTIVDAVPKNDEEEEMRNLIEFIAEKCVNVDTPLSIRQVSRDFNNRHGVSIHSDTIATRVKGYCREIQKGEFWNTHITVRQLFGLSAIIDLEYLKKLRTEALVEIDDRNRITHYKSNDGKLELNGDHSQSAKTKTGMLELKRSLQSLIIDYFKNEKNADEVPKSEVEKEMGNLIEFITEKCDNVNSPLSIRQLANDFNEHFKMSRALDCIHKRLRAYCRVIQKAEFLRTPSKVKQLFCLSVSVNSDCLKELRKNALIEVDEKNRIVEYTANDNSLTLRGSHWGFKKTEPRQVVKKNEKTVMATADDLEEDSDSEGLDDSSDEYSSEEFDSEFDSDDENGLLDETEVHTEPSHEPDDFDNDTSVRNCSSTKATVDDNFDFHPPTERSHGSEEIAIREDEEKENDQEITGNAEIKTRSGRLSKRRHLESDFSYNLVNSRSSATPTSSDSTFSRPPAKQRKRAIEKEQASSSSNQSRSSRSIRRSTRHSSFPSISTESGENMGNHDGLGDEGNPSEYHGPRIQEMDDYDWNPRDDNHPESSPIDNNLEESKPLTSEEQNLNKEAQNTDKRSDAVAPEKPEKESLDLQNNQNSTPQANGNEFVSIENHIHFLKALRPMMATLDTPTFAEDKLRIDKTIEKFLSIGNEEEKIRMNEIRTSLMTCLLIVERSAKKEIVKGEDTTSFETFLSLFQSYLVTLELKELDGFIKRVKHLKNEPTVNEKKVPTKKVQFALHSIIEIIAP